MNADEELIATEILKQAQTDASMSLDGMSQSGRSLESLIAVDKHLSKKRGSRFGFGIGMLRSPEHF